MKNNVYDGGDAISMILRDNPRYYNDADNIVSFFNILAVNDFIIVGGGPVGLQTVIQMSEMLKKDDSGKKSEFKRKICIIEKRDSNERRQILFVEPMFWKDIPLEIKQYINMNGGLCLTVDKLFNCINEPSTDFDSLNELENPPNGYVRIDILQDAYYAYLSKLENVYICLYDQDIDILFNEIKSTNVKNIILSDGGGLFSLSYKVFGGKPNYINIKISNAIVLGFDCNIKPDSIANYPELLQKKLGKDNELLNQRQLLTFVAKNLTNAGKYSGYIGLQLCDESYESISSVNSINKKNYKKCSNIAQKQLERLKDIYIGTETKEDDCYNITESTVHHKLRTFPEFALIQHALNLFDNVEMTAVSVFEIKLSTAKQFYKRIGDQYYYLIGDAAYKTHFFTGTGLNRGFASSSILFQLLSKPDFNRELLGTSFNLAQMNMRNKLWKEQIPKYMFDLCKLHELCKLKPEDLENNEAVIRTANCFFENSRRLFSNPRKNEKGNIILWEGNNILEKYNTFINTLTENTKLYADLLKLILSEDIIDFCVIKTEHCELLEEEKSSKLTNILKNLNTNFKETDKNFTNYEGGKKKQSRISKAIFKRKHSKRRN